MIERLTTDRSYTVRAATVLAARALLGLGLGLVLSVVGLIIAWGLFIFSSSGNMNAFMIMTIGGAGIGAGIGAGFSWMKLDRQQRPVLALIVLACVAGGIVGGLAGYQYGANREYDCCAEPTTTPFTFVAVGSAIAANLVMYLITAGTACARMARGKRDAVESRH